MARRSRTNSIDHLSARVDAIESTLRELLDGFSEIKSAIVRHEAAKPISAREWLGIAREGIIIAGAFTALVYFIVRPELNDLRFAVSRLEKQVEFSMMPPDAALSQSKYRVR
jgi:hypothetical protein